MPTLKKILVAVDFGPASVPALEWADFLAEPYGAELEAFHVWVPPPDPAPGAHAGIPDELEGSFDEVARAARGEAVLERLLGIEHMRRTRVARQVAMGNPADAVLERAERGGFDLIVVGTHGRRGLAHLVMGSVAESIVRRSQVPVVSVHAPRGSEHDRRHPSPGDVDHAGPASRREEKRG